MGGLEDKRSILLVHICENIKRKSLQKKVNWSRHQSR